MIGRSLGPYEIREQLGAGGMGEVYLAEDTRLGRQVAVKVLPEQFAADPDRLARFEQESRASAALNHPHIAAVFDVGEATDDDGTTHFMVQEYLQGESLRDFLDRGRPVLERSLALGAEIAEALRAAHKAGIVHRDLKPENVFVTEDGHAKVLDFGLAKLTEVARSPLSSQSMSPTVLGTQAGEVMGTAGYMAPEQVQGEEVDERADLFAFGCLLWEMCTGQRAFAGKSVPHTLHKILDEEPEGADTDGVELPLRLQWLLDKALSKSPEARAQSAGDLLVDLRRVSREVESGTAITAATARAPGPDDANRAAGGRWPASLLGAAAVLLIAVGAAIAWLALRPGPVEPATPVRFSIPLPDGLDDFANRNQQVLTISRDGARIAFIADDRIWVRSLADDEPAPLRNTTDPRAPTFSPDGRQLAYWDQQQIWRVEVGGGAPVVVGDVGPRPQGLTWADDGNIYVGSTDGSIIWRLPETGGEPESVFEADEGQVAYGPRLLPGGEWLLFTLANGRDWDSAEIVAQSLISQERRTLVQGGHDARITPTGHLVYVTDGVLLGLPFDSESVSVGRGAVPLLQSVRASGGRVSGAAYYAISDSGTLISTRSFGDSADTVGLAWTSRSGATERLPLGSANFMPPIDLSLDGRFVAAQVAAGENEEIWLYSVDRAGEQRLTSGRQSSNPVWSPDAAWVYYAGVRESSSDADLWRRRADLSAPEELVLEMEGNQWPASVSSDGSWLYFHSISGAAPDIYRISLEGDAEPEPVLQSPSATFDGRISPDGRFLAYTSNETGSSEIFVVEVETGRRWRISPSGGRFPVWSPDGEELIYGTFDSFSSASIATKPEFQAGVPERLVVGNPGTLITRFNLSPDGERILHRFVGSADVGDADSVPPTAQIDVVLNWFEELRERVPTER